MKALIFSSRTAKEILRDPLTFLFGLGFPIILIALLSLIQRNIPVSLFQIDLLGPAMTIFGLSFLTLFSSLLISKDRESAFLSRLFTTPLKPIDYIIGYTLPLLVMAILQTFLTLLFSLFFGLKPTIGILYCVIANIPSAIFFISLGLLLGTLLSSKQVGGICGALLTNLTAWLSGIWFNLDLVGGAFKKIALILPFYHAVEIEKSAYSLFSINFEDIIIVLLYSTLTFAISILVFFKKMKNS